MQHNIFYTVVETDVSSNDTQGTKSAGRKRGVSSTGYSIFLGRIRVTPTVFSTENEACEYLDAGGVHLWSSLRLLCNHPYLLAFLLLFYGFHTYIASFLSAAFWFIFFILAVYHFFCVFCDVLFLSFPALFSLFPPWSVSDLAMHLLSVPLKNKVSLVHSYITFSFSTMFIPAAYILICLFAPF